MQKNPPLSKHEPLFIIATNDGAPVISVCPYESGQLPLIRLVFEGGVEVTLDPGRASWLSRVLHLSQDILEIRRQLRMGGSQGN